MKKLVLLFFVAMLLPTVINAQSKADIYFESNYFQEAIYHFEIELQRKKADKKNVFAKLGESHFQLRNFDESKDYFMQLYALGSTDSLTVVRLFELHRNSCDYEEAEQLVMKHSTFFEPNAKLNKVEFPAANNSVSNNELIVLEYVINGTGMGLDFIDDEKIIVGRTAEQIDDRLKQNEFSIADIESKELKRLETESLKANGISYPSIDKNHNKIYFSASSFKKKRAFANKSNVLQLYRADFDGINISNIEVLPFVNDKFNYTHPSITPDGRKLFFVSDLSSGYGGTDIYYVNIGADGNWSEPVNCGPEINTKYNELTPFALNDTLYFSSYGHENYGGSDIFMALRTEGGFSKAENLGLPINSCRDDFSFALSPYSDFALFTSNRLNEFSKKDELYKVLFPANEFFVFDEVNGKAIAEVAVQIESQNEAISTDDEGKWMWRTGAGKHEIIFDHPYYWKRNFSTEKFSDEDEKELKEVKLSPVMIFGKAVDDITGNPIVDVNVSLYEKDGDDWVLVEVKKTEDSGDWSFHVRKDREYKVEFEKDKYLSSNEVFERFDDDRDLHNEAMKRVNPLEMSYKPEKDLVMQIDNIYFDYNKASLREESFKVLDKLIEYLNKNADIRIELSAHTDCIGKDSYNLHLSQRRANSCKAYLLKKGIAQNRITAKGYGKQKMIITDCDLQRRDDSAAQKNRRVEVKIL